MDIVIRPEFALVGEAPAGCKEVLYKKKPAKVPQGFKVSPVEALALAAKGAGFDCSGKSQRYVRANAKSYMILNVTQMDSGGLKYSTVVINGTTGEVIKSETVRWPPVSPASAVGTTQRDRD